MTMTFPLFHFVIFAGVGLIALASLQRLRRRSTALVRLGRLAPPSRAEVEGSVSSLGGQWLGRVFRVIDPTFRDLEKDLISAGLSRRFISSALEIARLLIAVIVAFLAAKFAGGMLGGTANGIGGAITGFICGLYGTRQITKVIVKGRSERALSELFFAIDLLIIFLESGQSLVQSLHSLADVGQASMPLTTREHRKLVSDLSTGLAYEKAFNAWAERIGAEQAHDLAAFFTQALVHGVELGPQLRRFADEMTARRLINARESVGMKSARLTVVMIVFFLPAILLLLAGPPVVVLLRHFGGLH